MSGRKTKDDPNAMASPNGARILGQANVENAERMARKDDIRRRAEIDCMRVDMESESHPSRPDVQPLTPDEERDLRIDLGDRSEKADHPERCQCQECREADDARDMLRVFATLDDARRALFAAQTALRVAVNEGRSNATDYLRTVMAKVDAALEDREVLTDGALDSEQSKEVTHGRARSESSAPPRDNGGSDTPSAVECDAESRALLGNTTVLDGRERPARTGGRS